MATVLWAVPIDRRGRSKRAKYHVYRQRMASGFNTYLEQLCRDEAYDPSHVYSWSRPPLDRRCQECDKLLKELVKLT